MKKLSLLLVVVMLFAVCFSACGSEAAEENATEVVAETSSVDLTKVLDAIITGVEAKDPLIIPADRLSSLYGIEAALVKQSACYVTVEGAFPDEIVLIEAVSEEAAATIQGLLETRLSEVKEQSKSYDPDNYALAQKCTVDKKGTYVSMFLAPEHVKMKSIFDSHVK